MPRLLPHNWQVPGQFRSRLGTIAGRQRVMAQDGHLLLVLHTPPAGRGHARMAAFFWRSPDGTWKAAGAAKGGVKALWAHVESFVKPTEALENQFEKAQHAADYFAVLQASAPLLRTARNLHRALQEAREAAPNDEDLINLRDRAGETERALELLHGDAKNGLEYTTAKQAEEQAEYATSIAEASHRLNLLAALFFPITAIGTMFSVNLRHGLESWLTPWLFWAFLLLSLTIGLVLRRSLKTKSAASRPRLARIRSSTR